MPIIDKELVNNTPYENLKRSNVPISQFFIERVKQNIAQHGDAQWMVSTFLSFSSACNPDTLSWNIISQIPSNNHHVAFLSTIHPPGNRKTTANSCPNLPRSLQL